MPLAVFRGAFFYPKKESAFEISQNFDKYIPTNGGSPFRIQAQSKEKKS